ncbi:MAG TPA: FliM/FliN family flagellar motor C-terminal domain-containing protein [Bryobacteraceae bacterium]|nr:FliM/FliN family flagellar motor C-terminal domain-containing protein [Bryobacteraceae bacterium]
MPFVPMQTMDLPELEPFLDVVFRIDAGLDGPVLKIDELLALRSGSVILTGRPAGENVMVTAGQTFFGAGELGCSKGRAIVRMLSFGSEG